MIYEILFSVYVRQQKNRQFLVGEFHTFEAHSHTLIHFDGK